MKNKATHSIAIDTIKRPRASGTLQLLELSSTRSKKNKLVILAEIEVSDKDNEFIIEQLAKEIEQQFFNAPTNKAEYAFENALTKANIKVKDTLLAKPKNWLNNIHISVVALCGEEVHIASVGNTHAFLIHKDKIIDVLKPTSAPTTPNPLKLFTNIVSGNLGPNNTLVLANESVLDYLSRERIKKLAIEFDAQETLEHLIKLLANAPESKQFGLGVISNKTTVEYKPVTPKIEANTKTITKSKSVTEPKIIIDTVNKPKKEHSKPSILEQEKTDILEEYLTPKNVKKFESTGKAMASVSVQISKFAQTSLTMFLSLLSKLLEKLQHILKHGIPLIMSFSKTAVSSIKNQKARTYLYKQITTNTVKKIKNTIQSRPKKQQIAGITILALIVVFVLSISFRAKENTEDTISANIQNKIFEIEEKLNQAEAYIIYGNQDGATFEIAQANALLESLHLEYPNQEELVSSLQNSLDQLKNKSEKKQHIENIITIATIVPSPINANQAGLIATDKSIFLFDGIQEKISSLDIENNRLMNIDNQDISSFNTALSLDNSDIIALSKDSVVIIDSNTELVSTQEFDYNPKDSSSFASYGNNIYTFDTNNNKIIRYRRAGKSFTSAQNWLQQEYELATIQDILVDGFIYLLDSQGSIHVFLRGKFDKRLPWPVADEPGNSLQFYSNTTSDSFYILDKENSRIIHTTKSGELIVQLTNDILNNAIDIVTNSSETYLYVLAKDKIYQIDLQKI